MRILDAVLDGPVAVESDAAQVENGGGAEEDVEREEELTHVEAEYPVAVREEERDVKGHDERGHERVRQRQAHYEVVLHVLQRPVREHRQHDKYVAQHAHEAHNKVGDTCDKHTQITQF